MRPCTCGDDGSAIPKAANLLDRGDHTECRICGQRFGPFASPAQQEAARRFFRRLLGGGTPDDLKPQEPT